MNFTPLGKTGFNISALSFGASSLGSVFRPVTEGEAVAAVHAALEAGMNLFDVAPAYGGTRAETLLGKGLQGVPRESYHLSTKAGKWCDDGGLSDNRFDFSREAIVRSVGESAERLGIEHIDIVHLHDFEYEGGRHLDQALGEGLETLRELKQAGRIGAIGAGIYPVDLIRRLIAGYDFDALLVHNHYCLNDTQLLDLLAPAREKGIGIINASPFATGLLTGSEPPDWHPASTDDRAVLREAAAFCREQGTSISKLAVQFSTQHPEIPSTLFSTARTESVHRNVTWHGEPFDPALVAEVRRILRPVADKDWDFGGWSRARLDPAT